MVPLISEHYREQNRLMHERYENYGAGNVRHLDNALYLCGVSSHKTVLDYGCGKGLLVKAIKERGIDARGYDPAVEEFSARPEPADLVICTDVLEHIEPDCVDAVLDDLASLANKAVFLLVSTVPAKKILPDGRNAHLSLKTASEWRVDLEKRFTVAMLKGNERGFMAVLHK